MKHEYYNTLFLSFFLRYYDITLPPSSYSLRESPNAIALVPFICLLRIDLKAFLELL